MGRKKKFCVHRLFYLFLASSDGVVTVVVVVVVVSYCHCYLLLSCMLMIEILIKCAPAKRLGNLFISKHET